MTKKRAKFIKALGVFIAVLIIGALGIFWAWLKQPPLSSAKLRVLKIVPFPMALVNGRPIPAKLLSDLTGNHDLSQYSQNEIYAGILRTETLKAVASKYDAENLAGKLPSDYTSQGAQVKDALNIYFNSQKNLNADTYKLAEDLLLRATNREDFAQLTKIYSQDAFSKAFGGENGKISQNELLPELQTPLSQLAINQIKLFPSRLGLHIIKLNQKTGDAYQLQQIFIPTNGFEQWLNQQIQLIKIKTIIQP